MINWDERTVGIEIELPRSHVSVLEGMNEFISFSNHDDGSLRESSYTLEGGLCVLPMEISPGIDITCSGMNQERAYGLEMVTRPYQLKEIRPKLNLLSRHYRHVPKDPVCSIHLHVDIAGLTWRYVQNLFRWSHSLEAILFRLASGGKPHRGINNDYQFCRPLSNPIGATWGRTRGPLILLDEFLSAKTSSEMAFAWGRTDRYFDGEWNIPHYVGHRYHMVNLMSCFRIGTFEWRLFDPLYSKTDLFTEVAIAVHKLADQGEPDFAPYVLGSEPDLTCADVSRLLDLDISPLWGQMWQPGCISTHPDPHTAALAFNRGSPVTIRYDMGGDDDPLYVR